MDDTIPQLLLTDRGDLLVEQFDVGENPAEGAAGKRVVGERSPWYDLIGGLLIVGDAIDQRAGGNDKASGQFGRHGDAQFGEKLAAGGVPRGTLAGMDRQRAAVVGVPDAVLDALVAGGNRPGPRLMDR